MKYTFQYRALQILPHTRLRLSAFPTAAAVTALGDDIKDHLSRLLTPIFGTDNLNRLVLGLVAGDLDLSASLLAEVVDGSTTGADDESVMCVSQFEKVEEVSGFELTCSFAGQAG
jgi:hypothetical protein